MWGEDMVGEKYTWLSLEWHSGPAGFLWLRKKNTELKRYNQPTCNIQLICLMATKSPRFSPYKNQTILQFSVGKNFIYKRFMYSNDWTWKRI